MMKNTETRAIPKYFLTPIFVFLYLSVLWSADWPQYQGPNRNSISSETGILKTWSESGPSILWRSPLGEGYSGISVAAGKIYTMYAAGNDEFLVCLDANNGKQLWRLRIDNKYIGDQGDGPRSTPTVDGTIVYGISGYAKLYAVDAASGKKIWAHDLAAKYGGRGPHHGVATSSLVEGNLLLVEVGGNPGKGIVAFDKKTGAESWSALTDQAGYSSPTVADIQGIRQLLFFTGTALVSLSPQGKVYWKYPWRTRYDINVATPVVVPPDKIFISSSYDVGAALLQVVKENNLPAVREIWKSRIMKNHFHSSIFFRNHIYGFDDATLKCILADTGEERWKERGFGKGSLILADGHLIVLGERGQLALVEANPVEYREKARVNIIQGKTWTAPVLANGRLYIRNQKEMICVNFRKQ